MTLLDKLLPGALAAGLAIAAFTPAQSQDATSSRLDKILEAGVVRVGTTGDFPPISARDTATQSYVGHDIDAAIELAKDLGVKVEFVPADWKTLINGITADKYDVVMSGVSLSIDRAKVAGFTQPYLEFGTVPVTKKENAERFKSWADIDKQDVTVGTTLGTVFDAQAKAYFKTATLKQVEAPALGFQEVLSGRADVTITSNVDAAALVQRYPELMIVPVEKARSKRPASFMIAQDDQIWLNYLNNWITVKKMQGFFDQLDQKWLQAK
ncbi:transporter substrate-binding domain-containing protein [Mesorhizobium sp. ASY16-5R]|uniref:transporter substrate-binding domain-containing protein n=1 Tax=Mesorhizobium sp. ASY16-5R TaxID=3445772 RepID=UPI003F9FC030